MFRYPIGTPIDGPLASFIFIYRHPHATRPPFFHVRALSSSSSHLNPWIRIYFICLYHARSTPDAPRSIAVRSYIFCGSPRRPRKKLPPFSHHAAQFARRFSLCLEPHACIYPPYPRTVRTHTILILHASTHPLSSLLPRTQHAHPRCSFCLSVRSHKTQAPPLSVCLVLHLYMYARHSPCACVILLDLIYTCYCYLLLSPARVCVYIQCNAIP